MSSSEAILFLYCDRCEDYVKVLNNRTCYCGLSKVCIEDGEIYFSEDTGGLVSVAVSALVKKKKKKELRSSDRIFVVKVLEYLNSMADTNFNIVRSSTHSQLILSRKADGFSYDDFVRVIDKKVREWKSTPSQIYLRPSTLFKKKNFENYVGEKGITEGATVSTFSKFGASIAAAKTGFFEDSRK